MEILIAVGSCGVTAECSSRNQKSMVASDNGESAVTTEDGTKATEAPRNSVQCQPIKAAMPKSSMHRLVVKVAMYYHDLTLIESRLLPEPLHLQEDLNGHDRWTTESSMKLHPAKCKTMHALFTRTPPLLQPLHINGHAFGSSLLPNCWKCGYKRT
ncbi:hypothetical protein Bbelb_158310 [Branchiostoma belcheri]|nr:hypothetical protein Bbelb_158310 [Branchiostoma belcheri]